MTNTVISNGGFGGRGIGGISLGSSWTFVGAVRFDTAPSAGNYPTAFGLIENSSTFETWNLYIYPPDDLDGWTLEWKPTSTSSASIQLITSSASAAGKWMFFGLTWNVTSHTAKIYTLFEGFDPASPSYLIPTNTLGTIDYPVGHTPDWLNIWTDQPGGADPGTNIAIGGYRIINTDLSEAQVLAEFASRSIVSSTTPSTSLLLDDATSNTTIGHDSGSTASNFTITGSFSAFAHEPSEWSGGSGSLIDVDAGTDTPAASDSLSASTQYARSGSDTAAVTDSVTAALVVSVIDVSVSDTAAIADSIARTLDALRTASDTASTTDSIVVGRELGRSASDSIAILDSGFVETVDLIDTVSVTDSVARGLEVSRSASDTAAISDALAISSENYRSGSDTASVADALGTSLEFARALTDSASLTDTIDAQVLTPSIVDVAVSDTTSASDATALACEYARTSADSFTATDDVSATTAAIVDVAVSDSFAVADALQPDTQYIRSGLDTVALSDSAVLGLDASRTASDTAGLTDSCSHSVEFLRAIGDTASISDASALEVQYLRSLADSIAASDATTVERLTPGVKDVAVSDAVSITDLEQSDTSYQRFAQDSLSIGDSPSRDLQASRSASDTATVTDSVSIEVDRLIEIAASDVIATTDVLAFTLEYLRSVSDAASLTDTLVRDVSYRRDLSDALDIADAVSASTTNHEVDVDLFDTSTVADAVSTLVYLASGTLPRRTSAVLPEVRIAQVLPQKLTIEVL